MKPTFIFSHQSLCAIVLVLAFVSWPGSHAAPQPDAAPVAAKPVGKKPAVFEVKFSDDTTMRITVLEERIDLVTQYGTLQIPVADIRRIELGYRISEADAKKLDSAIIDLAHKDFAKRQAAEEELIALGPKAYPSLVLAAKDKDKERQRKAEELLDRLRQMHPAEKLEVKSHDVLHTEDSKIAGKLTMPALRVNTMPFGDQPLQLQHVRSIQSLLVLEEAVVANALPDPGHLNGLANQVGKVFYFRVTGAQPGQGGCYGTEVYTTDSHLATAATHSGVLKAGQTGVVKVTMLGNVPTFAGSHQHGITSNGYSGYTGYRISK